MAINETYNESEIMDAIGTALDNFYTNLINKVNSLNIKAVMKRKNPYLFRAKAMNGAAQIIDAVLAAFVSSSEETIFGNVFFEPIATAAAQGQKALAEGVDIMVQRDDTIYSSATRIRCQPCLLSCSILRNRIAPVLTQVTLVLFVQFCFENSTFHPVHLIAVGLLHLTSQRFPVGEPTCSY